MGRSGISTSKTVPGGYEVKARICSRFSHRPARVRFPPPPCRATRRKGPTAPDAGGARPLSIGHVWRHPTLHQAIDPPTDPLTFSVGADDGVAMRKTARLVARVTEFAVTDGDAYDVWPSPDCDPAVYTCYHSQPRDERAASRLAAKTNARGSMDHTVTPPALGTDGAGSVAGLSLPPACAGLSDMELERALGFVPAAQDTGGRCQRSAEVRRARGLGVVTGVDGGVAVRAGPDVVASPSVTANSVTRGRGAPSSAWPRRHQRPR